MEEQDLCSSRKTPPIYKIIVLGESNVGKSSLFVRYIEDAFNEALANTIGINNYFKEASVDGNAVHLQMWDTAGQERFKSIVSAFYRESDGFVFVYDIGNERSFEYMRNLIDELKNYLNPRFTVLLGNKIDKFEDKREIEFEKKKLSDFATAMNFRSCLVSAKTGMGVNEVFEDLSRNLFYNKIKEETNIKIVKLSKKKRKWKKWC